MWKQTLGFGIGIVVGAVVIYVVYNDYKNNHCKDKYSGEFTAKSKESEAKKMKLKELLSTQTYIEVLTAKELTAWFRENRGQFKDNIKMLIITPTAETLAGLGYQDNGEIDAETNIIQLFYNSDDSEVLKIRLVNYSNMEPNLQAHLIEEDGIIVVTD